MSIGKRLNRVFDELLEARDLTPQQVAQETKIDIKILKDFNEIDTYQFQIVCDYFYITPLYFFLHKYVAEGKFKNLHK